MVGLVGLRGREEIKVAAAAEAAARLVSAVRLAAVAEVPAARATAVVAAEGAARRV